MPDLNAAERANTAALSQYNPATGYRQIKPGVYAGGTPEQQANFPQGFHYNPTTGGWDPDTAVTPGTSDYNGSNTGVATGWVRDPRTGALMPMPADQGPTVQLDNPHPNGAANGTVEDPNVTAPTLIDGVLHVPPSAGNFPATPAPATTSSGPYDAFNKAYRGVFGRDITQEQLNSNEYLQQLGNDLFRLLPLDRQVGFSSARIALLANKDLMPVLERLGQLDPKGLATAFPTKFWLRFDNDWIANKMLPLLRQNNPAEADNIIRQNQIGGANAGALPAEQRPATPAPSTGVPAPSNAAPQTGGTDLTGPLAPGAGTSPAPYVRPSGYDIPRITPSTVPALPIGEGGVPNALDLYLGMIGASNYGRAPGVSGLSETVDNSGSYNFEKGGSPVGARLSNATTPYPFAGNFPQTSGVGDTDSALRTQPHSGRDYAFPAGTPVQAAYAGVVSKVYQDPDFGTVVVVDHPDRGTSTSYGHLSNTAVRVGDRVNAGDALATSGSTGKSTGPHLHFEENPIGNGPGYRGPDAQVQGDTGGNDWTDYDPGTGTFLDRRTGRRVNPDGSDAAPPGFTYIKQPVLDVLGKPTGQYQYTLTRDPTYQPPKQATPNTPLDDAYKRAQMDDIARRAADNAAQIALGRDQLNEAIRQHDVQAQMAAQDRLDRLSREAQQIALNQSQLQQRQGEFAAQLPIQQAGVTGFYGGAPTLDRERAIAEQDLRNFTANVDAAYRAGQIDLQMRNQAVQERAQGLNERIQTGRLGLETRAQTESETQGAFGRGLQAAQFQFQVGKDPASAFVKTQNARDLLTPGGTTQGATPAPAQFGGQGQFAIPQVQDYNQAFGQNPNVSGAVVAATGANGEFRIPSQQRLAGLLPSERAQLGAGLNVMGLNPEDVYDQSQKLTRVTPAPAVNTVVRGTRTPAGAY